MDPRQALVEAFRRLDAFFIEGVGTFRKLSEPAHVEGSRVLPPALRVVLENGQSAGVVSLSEPLQEWAQLDAIAAQSLVHRIAGWIRSTVQGKGKFLIPQVGEIVPDRNGGFKLESPAVAPGFFGLGELELTLTRHRKEKQAEPPVEPVAEKQPVVEPVVKAEATAPEIKVRVPEERVIVKPVSRKGRALPILWLLLLVLLIGGGAAGYIFRNEIRTKLTEWGWIDGGKTPGDSTTHHVDSLPIDTSAGQHTGKVEPGDGNEPDKGVVKGELQAGAPVPGMHYLVIACVKDEAIATRSVNEMRAAGLHVTVLQKEWSEGTFKITTFESNSRKKVIDQMVKLKDKYPDSWIYPPMR